MFPHDIGMRIDLVLATAPVASRLRAAWIDRQARKGKFKGAVPSSGSR
jgi:exodeoxyribonuclease III